MNSHDEAKEREKTESYDIQQRALHLSERGAPSSFLSSIVYSSSTVMASVGHEATQASQRMQSSALTGTDFLFWSSNTSTGQTSTQTPSPSHFSTSTITFTILFNLNLILNDGHKGILILYVLSPLTPSFF
jgi:hypothetical protein